MELKGALLAGVHASTLMFYPVFLHVAVQLALSQQTSKYSHIVQHMHMNTKPGVHPPDMSRL